MLNSISEAFNRSRGKWKGKPVTLELIKGAKCFLCKAIIITKAYEKTTRKEVDN